ncbi:MAG: hypothetical protein ACEQSQ_11750 [Candidatus Paceibacteria bacterium]
MLNECLDLINTKIDVKVEDKTLTEKLKVWRKDRNISKADYLVFVGNILEELMEPLWSKNAIEINKQEILDNYFQYGEVNELEALDSIKDIKVFCINETENMGYDDTKTDDEVFKHINCRKQDPSQMIEWKEKGAYGKWKKWSEQPEEEIYQPDYESCKL